MTSKKPYEDPCRIELTDDALVISNQGRVVKIKEPFDFLDRVSGLMSYLPACKKVSFTRRDGAYFLASRYTGQPSISFCFGSGHSVVVLSLDSYDDFLNMIKSKDKVGE